MPETDNQTAHTHAHTYTQHTHAQTQREKRTWVNQNTACWTGHEKVKGLTDMSATRCLCTADSMAELSVSATTAAWHRASENGLVSQSELSVL